MDPVTASLLIKLSSELGLALITTLRASGRGADAAQIEEILQRSDAQANDIIATAQAELARLRGEPVPTPTPELSTSTIEAALARYDKALAAGDFDEMERVVGYLGDHGIDLIASASGSKWRRR